MKLKNIAVRLASLVLVFALGGWSCSSGDGCKAAKQHMCENITSMNCYAAFMDNAQQKIINACGQAELDAYIPVVQAACSASVSSGTAMNCGAIAGKTYAARSPDAGGTCDAGAPMKFTYSGTATADGRSAQLEFTIAGTAVTGGRLTASPVCSPNIHLNRTDVSFTGTLVGAWESPTGVITATWTGGDYACDGTLLTPAEGYPTSGSLAISMVGTTVSLQRIITNAEPYQFTATNQKYTPPTATCGPPPAVDSGARDSSPSDVRLQDSSAPEVSPLDSRIDVGGPYDSAREVSPIDSSIDVSISYDGSPREVSPLDSSIDVSGTYDSSLREASLFDSSAREVTPQDRVSDLGGTQDSTVRDSSGDALGPVCTKLAACCPTITDIPALRQDCVTTLSNGLGDTGCQITWNSLTRLGYCVADAGP
jgi:hypothetical protein